ncbi:protein CREG1-like isoform X2 [Pyrus x bretschneideri]|uniref:protein CREG1-like isoform X2 n=1 Tax=Pyrus x bretschneideri TaxID=225117 RepID=UPI00202E6A8F|nr:protein CREG1-like isoform X2 [Pyrus x bretschneideri]
MLISFFPSLCTKTTTKNRQSPMTTTTTTMIKGLVHFVFAVYLVSLPSGIQLPVDGRVLLLKKPDPENAAATARWLVAQNSWGVLKNVVSFSDGEPGNGRGIPYFYLTTLDPTARNALNDPRASLTISEHPIGTCGKRDPENPTCAKLTLNGKLKLADPKETEFAISALFTKHPEMKDWPKGHNFQFFKLDIENIFLIDWFGGPKPLTVDQYLHLKTTENALIRGLLVI